MTYAKELLLQLAIIILHMTLALYTQTLVQFQLHYNGDAIHHVMRTGLIRCHVVKYKVQWLATTTSQLSPIHPQIGYSWS